MDESQRAVTKMSLPHTEMTRNGITEQLHGKCLQKYVITKRRNEEETTMTEYVFGEIQHLYTKSIMVEIKTFNG